MNESNIFGMSVRVIVASAMVLLCCGLAIFTKDMPVLEKLAYVATGFLFGRASSGSGNDRDISGGKPTNIG